MNDTKKIISQILSLPENFRSLGNNKSFNDLLKETGYSKDSEVLKEEEILETLKKRPEAVQSWVMWSENKRTSSGWYIKNDKGKYIVSFFPHTEGIELIENQDAQVACAYFIKREIEAAAKNL